MASFTKLKGTEIVLPAYFLIPPSPFALPYSDGINGLPAIRIAPKASCLLRLEDLHTIAASVIQEFRFAHALSGF